MKYEYQINAQMSLKTQFNVKVLKLRDTTNEILNIYLKILSTDYFL